MKAGDRFGRFRIDGDLGAGGMAQVFLAWDTARDRPVALKLLRTGRMVDPELVPRFIREAETYRKLRHPNIVGYVGSGVQDEVYYLAVEYVDGRDLAALLARRREPWADRRVRPLLRDLLLALGHAHAHGIVHRDIKPQNVMISRRGEVKLLDFGVARADDHLVETGAGLMLGTFRYSSPEQNRGEPVDARADLYAAGLLLYEMLAGRPLLSEKYLELVAQQRDEFFPALPAAARAWTPLCRRLLRADPAARYPDAAAALADFPTPA